MNWRTRQTNQIARDIVKKRVKMNFMRNGRLVEAVPTLEEARAIALDMQRLLDVANGDVTMNDAFGRNGRH